MIIASFMLCIEEWSKEKLNFAAKLYIEKPFLNLAVF